MTRALGRVAFWLLPPLFLLLVYWPGVGAWFQADDFAWLSLWRQVHDWPSFLHVMFAPMAQGTIRPWSERGFFLLFHWMFGVDALPWRIFVFLNACGCLVLLALIARRITADQSRFARYAACIAPLVWIASWGLPVPMTWSSDYNQIQCTLFLLGAFYLRLRGVYWAEMAAFVLGFGALEINIVYPAIALVWSFIARRGKRDLVTIAPLFLISCAYYFLHAHLSPPAAGGPYAMHFDRAMFGTLYTYWDWAMLSPQWAGARRPERVVPIAAAVFTAFLAFAAVRERRAALFGLAWFLLTLAPLLPLRDHISDYYLTIPAAGLALAFMAGVSALSSVPARAAACALAALYVGMNAPLDRSASGWYAARSQRIRTLVLGAVTARERNPGQAILLDGVDEQLYDAAIADSPFVALNVPEVYLSPETEGRFSVPANLIPVADAALPPGPTLHALAADQIVVYRLDGDRLRNVTSAYELSARATLKNISPERVDAGNPLMAYLLGPEWYALEGNHRWMPRQATVRLGGPRLAGSGVSRARLVLTGYCPEAFLREGPLKLAVEIDGESLAPAEISKPEEPFVRMFGIPASVQGRDSVLVRLTLNRALRSGSDSRELGLAFGVIEFRP